VVARRRIRIMARTEARRRLRPRRSWRIRRPCTDERIPERIERPEAEPETAALPGAASPRESGVYAPGAADEVLALGRPPRLDIGDWGADPKVLLVGTGGRLARSLKGSVRVAIQTGPKQAMPTVDMLVVMTAGKTSPEPTLAATPPRAVATVTGAKSAREQPGILPPGTEQQLHAIRGSRIELEVSPSGGAQVARIQTPPASDSGIPLMVMAAGNTLALAFMAYPADPVGVGAFWTVTSRETYLGLDVIVQGRVEVIGVEPNKVVLDLAVDRFVAGGRLQLPGVPRLDVVQFESHSSGMADVVPSDTPRITGWLEDKMNAVVRGGDTVPTGGASLAIRIQMKSDLALAR
jgi:hypothetical protein